MKKILAILICAFLICTFTFVTSAEEVVTEVVTEAVTEVVTETVTEVGFFDLFVEPSVDKVMAFIGSHFEEISVILTLIFSALVGALKNKQLNTSVTTLNNNSVKVADNSLESMKGVSTVVKEYKDAMSEMLSEIRRNNEERASLEESLAEVSKYLKATRLANVELSNVMSEILLYANIPNSKKDEFYSRHLSAVNLIAEIEKAVAEIEEVKENEETNEE